MATPYRHGSKVTAAETFFLEGMTQALNRLAEQSHPGFPCNDLLRLQAIGAKGELERSAPAGKRFWTP